MKASIDLFDLVKSLSGPEKGYFKKHSAIKSSANKNYLQLFDAIEKQEVYDEAALRTEFKNHPFARQFPVAKTYLYERILTALDSYHSSDQETIRTHLHDAEVLHEKGLYGQALKAVKKAKEAALLCDLHYFLPEVFHWELNLAKEQYDLDWTGKAMDEQAGYLGLLQNTLAYRRVSLTIGLLAEKARKINTKEISAQIKKLIAQPALRSESLALTFTAKLYFHNSHFNLAVAGKEYSKGRVHLEKIVSLCEANPRKTKNNFHFYMVILNNLLEHYFENRNYENALTRLDKFRHTLSVVKDYSSSAYQFYVYQSYFLRYMKNTGQFSKAAALLPRIVKEQKQYRNELSQVEKIILHSFYALIWFGAEQYKKCIHLLNILRNELSLEQRPDIDSFLRVFYIIAHYEAGHGDLLPHLVRSAQRGLQKQQHPGRFEKIMLDFFQREFLNAPPKKKMTEAFIGLKNELLPLTRDPDEQNVFEFFDYISWLEGKIESKSFAEVVRLKVKKG